MMEVLFHQKSQVKENRIKEIEKKSDELVRLSRQYEITKEELLTILEMSLNEE